MRACTQYAIARAAGALALAIGLGLPAFTTLQGLALRKQAEVQKVIYLAVERSVHPSGSELAVVLTPNFAAIWSAYPQFAAIGTWVYDWRRPQLDLSDDILYLRDVPDAIPELRRLLSDRKFYRLVPLSQPPYVIVMPLDGGMPHPLIGTS